MQFCQLHTLKNKVCTAHHGCAVHTLFFTVHYKAIAELAYAWQCRNTYSLFIELLNKEV